MTKISTTILTLIASVAHTAAHGIPAEAVQSFGNIQQEEDCDVEKVCCAFEQPVTVVIDDDHSYVFDDPASKSSFVIIHRNWVNLQLRCDEDSDGEFVYEGIVFDNKKKGRYTASSNGGCRGKRCNEKYSPTGPYRRKFDACDDTLLHTLQVSNPQTFGDLNKAEVILSGDATFSDLAVTMNAVCPAPPTTLVTSSPTATPLSWIQIGDDVDGENNNNSDDLGRVVSLSGDGNRLVAAGNRVVRLYDNINGDWIEESFDFSSFVEGPVESIAMTSDGDVFIFGNPWAYSFTGAAFVFRKNSTWSQRGSTLAGDANTLSFGRSVAITDDGLTIAVGTKGDYAIIFRWNDSNNIFDTIHTFRGTPATYSGFGNSIAMASDGSTLAVGEPYTKPEDDCCKLKRLFAQSLNRVSYRNASRSRPSSLDRTGRVFIYSLNDFSVIEIKSGEAEEEYFGATVAMSADGTTLAVGAGYNEFGGYVMIYKQQNNIYDQSGAKIYVFQPVVALSNNGNRLAIGSPYFSDVNGNEIGNTFIYEVNDNSTLLIGELLGETAKVFSVYAFALSGDGGQVAIGNNNGQVRVYESSN